MSPKNRRIVHGYIKYDKGCDAPKPQVRRAGLAEGLADEVEARAVSMHLSTSKYCKIILTQWIESGKKLTLQERK